MFSTRTGWNVAANVLAQTVARRQAMGLPLIDLTESNPTRVGLGLAAPDLARALTDPRGALYEPHPLGLPTAREAIRRYYLSRGLDARTDRMVVTASTSEAYLFLFKLLCDPGDEILVPQPSYPLFEFLATLESVRTVGYPLLYDGEWRIDREALAVAWSPRTRAVVVVNPNHPTGSSLQEDELTFLADLCRQRKAALLGDEVFSDFPLQPVPGRAKSVLQQRETLTFALSGLSKILALPQIKIGWIVAQGPDVLVEQALQRLEIISDTFLSASTLAQLAVERLLDRRGPVQEAIRDRLRHNLATLHALHTSRSAWQPCRVEGGWSVLCQIPRTRSEQEWVGRLVELDGVLVHPGFFFDLPQEAFLAISLLLPPEIFGEGVARLASRVDAG